MWLVVSPRIRLARQSRGIGVPPIYVFHVIWGISTNGTGLAYFSSMIRLLPVLVLACGALSATGCDPEPVEAAPFEDGQRLLTSRGAFAVQLWSAQGEPSLGVNTFYVDVAMPDPSSPETLGWGIPDAQLNVTAHQPNGDAATEASIVQYVGAGRYQVEGLVFDEPGVWSLDVDIEVGQSMDEQVTFTFEL